MGLLWGCPLLLVVAAFQLGGCSDPSLHSLRLLSTVMWEPAQDLASVITAVGFLDDQLIGRYDLNNSKVVFQVSWGKRLVNDNLQLWDVAIQEIRFAELGMKVELINLQKHFNRSTGLHIWQNVLCCALSQDGRKTGSFQLGYDGEDYISFDKGTLTWKASMALAQVTKRLWDAEVAKNQFICNYLEEECIAWLQVLLHYGKESLLRREPPTVKVVRKATEDGQETLICHLYGFYPKEIDTTWQKDGEVWEQETFHAGLIPNSDGTYYTWLSIQIHPKDRDHFRCRVEHDSLPEPLEFAWEEPVLSKVGLIAGILVGVVAGLFVVGIVFYFWRRQMVYQAARGDPPTGDIAM